ncbi:anti-sigma factor antagonist [Azospirillum cavernae]|jgi:HptB-dependent secretion and biofilm anti anti-sigma factor|uniref:Anti-sigma factor antagonist n=1 Tax=Azospirillum cavernae TaxID=2320860 RepID=A0A418VY64_9PROT|nr:STAS domain-containing protein [Azospirillum cavernae]RJF82123.1 anti-sigma factor antagonist [Azospirillum cavernae]
MDFTVTDAHDSTEIRLHGRMTFSDHDTFRSVIAAFERPAGHRMVFDLSGLDFVDSSGLGMFIIARDTAQKKKLDFAMRGARDEVQRLITLAKLHKVFTIDA